MSDCLLIYLSISFFRAILPIFHLLYPNRSPIATPLQTSDVVVCSAGFWRVPFYWRGQCGECSANRLPCSHRQELRDCTCRRRHIETQEGYLAGRCMCVQAFYTCYCVFEIEETMLRLFLLILFLWFANVGETMYSQGLLRDSGQHSASTRHCSAIIHQVCWIPWWVCTCIYIYMYVCMYVCVCVYVSM